MKIKEIAFVGYCVTDMKRARAFYEGVLGLTLSRTFGENENDAGWIEYDIGPGTLAIIRGDGKDWKPSPDGTSAAFEVDDFDAYVAKIKENNVKVIFDVYESPMCWMITVADPDGNRLVIHKRK